MTKETTTAKSCHNGPTTLFINRGLSLGGASLWEATKYFYDYDLVISLEYLDIKKYPLVWGDVRSIELGRILDEYSLTEHIHIKWPDFSIPQVDKEFWTKLSRFLKKKGRDKERFNKVYKVMIHCMGGHGRTGTALAILASLCTDEGWQGEDLLEKIRRFHCSKSVENKKQIKYIEKILGFKLKGDGTKSLYSLRGSAVVSCMANDNMIRLHNKDIDIEGSCSLCRSTSRISIIEEEVRDKKKPAYYKANVLYNMDGSLFVEEEPIVIIDVDNIVVKNNATDYLNSIDTKKEEKFCKKHNSLYCRSCREENIRLLELKRQERDNELEDRTVRFVSNDKEIEAKQSDYPYCWDCGRIHKIGECINVKREIGEEYCSTHESFIPCLECMRERLI